MSDPNVMPTVTVRGTRPPSVDPDDLWAMDLLNASINLGGGSDAFVFTSGGGSGGPQSTNDPTSDDNPVLELEKVTVTEMAPSSDGDSQYSIDFHVPFYWDENRNGSYDRGEVIRGPDTPLIVQVPDGVDISDFLTDNFNILPWFGA